MEPKGVDRPVKSWLRKLVLPLVLACAGAQVGPGGALIASALMLGLHPGDHAHSLTILSDRGHRDLVLSHEGGHSEQAAGASAREHASPTPESHHVFHLTDDDARRAARRADLTPAAAVATAPAWWMVSTSAWVPLRSVRPHARGADLLRSVVLLL